VREREGSEAVARCGSEEWGGEEEEEGAGHVEMIAQ
jgi:hypothetical protein